MLTAVLYIVGIIIILAAALSALKWAVCTVAFAAVAVFDFIRELRARPAG